MAMQGIALNDTPGCLMRGLEVEHVQAFIDSRDDLKYIPMIDINGVEQLREFPRITVELFQRCMVTPPPPPHCIGLSCPDMRMVELRGDW